MQLFLPLIALFALASSVLSASLDDHSLWTIFKRLAFKDMQSFVKAHPHMLRDHNVRTLIECKGNYACAFLQSPNRLILDYIPHHLHGSFIRQAALKNDQQAVKRMINAGIDSKLLDYPLKRALRLNLNDQDQWIRSLLPYYMKNISIVKVDSEINSRELLAACRKGQVGTVKALIESGADVNTKIEWGKTPLMIASRRGDIQLLNLLIEAGADVNAREGKRVAVGQYNVNVIPETGVVNVNDAYGETALMGAVRYGQLETVKMLIEAGADLDAKCTNKVTALMFASLRTNIYIVKALIEAGADLEARNVDGATALMKAASYARLDPVFWLIDAGADVNAKDNYGETALMKAATQDYISTRIMDILREAGADVNTKNNWGITPLMFTAGFDYHDSVKWLIEAGADVNAKDNEGRTALGHSRRSSESRKELKRVQPSIWQRIKGQFT